MKPNTKTAKAINLSNGMVALVDAEDYEELSKYAWGWLSAGGYAVRGGKTPTGRRKTIFMHKEIMPAPRGWVTDHINSNPLDNRRANLRICRQRYNTANRTKRPGTVSKYKGVNRVIGKNGNVYWRTECAHVHVSHSATEEEAARVYDRRAWELWGNFAKLNFPDTDPSTYPPIVCALHRYYGGAKCARCGHPAPADYKPRRKGN